MNFKIKKVIAILHLPDVARIFTYYIVLRRNLHAINTLVIAMLTEEAEKITLYDNGNMGRIANHLEYQSLRLLTLTLKRSLRKSSARAVRLPVNTR